MTSIRNRSKHPRKAGVVPATPRRRTIGRTLCLVLAAGMATAPLSLPPADAQEAAQAAQTLRSYNILDTTQPQQFSSQFDYVPGVSVNSSVFRGFNVRGFNTSPANPQDNGTSVLVGNFVAPARRYHFDQGLYERIDVLKGTSAVLFGPSQAGGVVRYVPKRPEFEWRHRLQGTLGNFDTERGMLDSTGPLTEDLAYRLIVIGQDNNQTTHGSNSDVSFDERVVINPALTWLTPTGGELYLGYEYSDQTTSMDRGIARLPATGELLFNGKPLMTKDNVRTVETHVVTAEFTQPISDDWEFFIGGRYNDNEVLRRDFVSEGEFGGDPNLSSFTNFFNLREMEFVDLRAEVDGRFSTGWLDHQITVGVNYRDFKEAQPIRNVTFQLDVIDPRNPVFPDVPRIGPAPFKRDTDTEIKQFYVQDYVTIGEKLKVFGGLTWTDAEVSVRTDSGGAEGADEALDGSIGLIYNHNAWLNPFVSYATSLQPQTGTLLGGGVVPFSESDQIEIGLKSEWFDRRLRTTASVFQINKTNIAESAPPPNSDFAILAGDQRTRGFEFEAVGNVTDQFRITGGYSYFDAEFTESTTGNEGNTPFAVPKHKVSLFGEYAFTGELRGWRAGLGFIHVGDREADNDNTVEMPGYERVDLTLAYERGPFNFHARVENVFDEDYIIGGGDFLANRFEQGAPRLFTLTVGYEF